MLRSFEGVGPVAFGVPRDGIRATLGDTHQYLHTYDKDRHVPEDSFVTPGESAVDVEYDDAWRVLSIMVAIRAVTFPDGLLLVGAPVQEVIRQLRVRGHQIDMSDMFGPFDVADLGLRIHAETGGDNVILSVIARRGDYLDTLTLMNDEAPDDAVGTHTTVRCVKCDGVAASAEVIPPGRYPESWESWSATARENLLRYRPRGKWWWIYSGPGGGNGLGDAVSPESGRRFAEAFGEPVSYHKVATLGLHDVAGFCRQCEKPYCLFHWNMSAGLCPHGHWKSLDPHWSPDD